MAMDQMKQILVKQNTSSWIKVRKIKSSKRFLHEVFATHFSGGRMSGNKSDLAVVSSVMNSMLHVDGKRKFHDTTELSTYLSRLAEAGS